VVAAVVSAAAAVLAFGYLDPIIAAFVVILGVTLLVCLFLARNWDQHSTYEERENARAQRRAEKWERGAAARERDRVRWEAHQARQAEKAGGNSLDS
jgi:ABC-type transport system involved in cytochrome bd biosynthesis fused ATPase/permease subunit